MATDKNRPDLREAADAPEPEETDGNNDDEAVTEPDGAAGKVRAIRKRLARRRTERKASKLKRKRDFRNATAPVRERVDSARGEVSSAREEARALAEDVGVAGSLQSNDGEDTDASGGLLSSINQTLSESGGSSVQLDTDRDGFAEVEAVDINSDGNADRVREFDDPDEPPVGAVEEEIQPLDGVEEELGLDEPIEAGDKRIEANDDFFF